MNAKELAQMLDNALRFISFPDSIVGILESVDQDSRHRFEESYFQGESGLLIDNGCCEQVFVAAFPSRDVQEYLFNTKARNALLFVKHPMEWEELGKGFVSIESSFIELLSEQNISLYCAHAPVDNHHLTDPSIGFAEFLGQSEVKGSPQIMLDGRRFGFAISKKTTWNSLVEQLKNVLGLEGLQELYEHETIEKIGVVAGGGDSPRLVEEAVALGCDTYVTGILHFEGSEYAKKNNPEFITALKDNNMNGLGASHYLTERAGIQRLARFVGDYLNIDSTYIHERRKEQFLRQNWRCKLE